MASDFTQSKLLTVLLAFLLLMLGILYGYQASYQKNNILFSDYLKFYQSTQFAIEGKSIYTKTYVVLKKLPPEDPSPTHVKQVATMLDPPFFILAILPLGHFSYVTSLWLWALLSAACGVLGVLLAQKALAPKSFSLNNTLVFMLAFFIYFPTFANIIFGQLTLFLVPLVTGAWLAIRYKHICLAGILLGIAASIKPFFGLFLLYFLLRREWRPLLWFIGTIIICTLLALLAFGIKTYFDYYAIIAQIKWYSSTMNASLLGLLFRIFGSPEHNFPLIAWPSLSIKLYWLLFTLIIIGLIKFLWPTVNTAKIDPQKKSDLDFSVILISMLLLSPLGWLYYFPLLIVPMLVIFQYAKTHDFMWPRLALCASLVCTGFCNPILAGTDLLKQKALPAFMQSTPYTLALVILLGTIVTMRKTLFYNPEKLALPNKPQADLMEQTISYSIALLPSLFALLGVVNSIALFKTISLPVITAIFYGK